MNFNGRQHSFSSIHGCGVVATDDADADAEIDADTVADTLAEM